MPEPPAEVQECIRRGHGRGRLEKIPCPFSCGGKWVDGCFVAKHSVLHPGGYRVYPEQSVRRSVVCCLLSLSLCVFVAVFVVVANRDGSVVVMVVVVVVVVVVV